MAELTLKLEFEQFFSLIEQLDIEQKIKLLRKLENETWNTRFDDLIQRIWLRIDKYPISEEEIKTEIEITRIV